MSKKTGLYLMLAGAALSAYDMMTDGGLYGPGKPMERLHWKVATVSGKDWYISVSDIAAVVGAFVYFK